jgi:hydrogenase expression/formation protein HypE
MRFGPPAGQGFGRRSGARGATTWRRGPRSRSTTPAWALHREPALSLDSNSRPARQVALDHDAGARPGGHLADLVTGILGDVHLETPPASLVRDGRPAVATGSYVVDPPFFGNGDIGRVAVCGTVNDLVAAGAEPRWLALALIIEAGLPVELLRRVAASVRDSAREAGAGVAAVDVRVVRAGEADQVFASVTGYGELRRSPPSPGQVRPGDRLVVSGPLGSHAVHLMSLRAGLGFEHHVLSDCAPLGGMLGPVLGSLAPGAVRAVRPVGSGGLAAVLRSVAAEVRLTVRVDEAALPVQYEARTAFDMLGLAPWQAANAGCLALFAAPDAVDAVLTGLRAHPYGRHAAVVGEVTADRTGAVELRTADGGLDRLADEDGWGAEPPRLL